jgi:hypothetical protein
VGIPWCLPVGRCQPSSLPAPSLRLQLPSILECLCASVSSVLPSVNDVRTRAYVCVSVQCARVYGGSGTGTSWRAVERPVSRPVPERFAAASCACTWTGPDAGAVCLAVFGGMNPGGDCRDMVIVSTT